MHCYFEVIFAISFVQNNRNILYIYIYLVIDSPYCTDKSKYIYYK